jgi:HEAT repeat protein
VLAAYGSAGDKVRAAAADAVLAVAARSVSGGKPDRALAFYERLYSEKEPVTVRMGAMQGLVSLGGDRGTAVLFQALADSDAGMQAAALTTLRQATAIPVATIGERMANLPAPSQAKVILALADRGPGCRPIVMAAAKNKDAAVRSAAVQVLGSVGDASCVGLLAEIAASNDTAAEAGRTSLVRMTGDGINAAIVEQIKTARPEVQVQLVSVLAGRNAKETAPALLALVASDNPQVRRSGFAALKRLAGEQEARPLARLLAKGVADSEAEDAQAAALAACREIADSGSQAAPAISAFTETASIAGKVSLLRVMGSLGGKEALAVVQAASNDLKKEIKDAAIRALVEWPDAGPIQTVRRLAESGDDPTHRVLALRGFIRMIELSDLSEADMLGQYGAAIKMATRPDEKRQALAKISNIPSEAALKLAQALVADPALAGDATAAAAKIDKALKHPARCEASTPADVDKAVDGDPATRWTTGSPMQGGEWFLLDLGGERTVKKVILDCARSDGDYPRGYEVYVSNSKVRLGKPVAVGKGEGAKTEITFPPTAGRYIKIVQTGKVEGLYWSIHELTVE